MMERILKLGHLGAEVEVPVRIGFPDGESRSWFCRWEIRWPDRVQTNSAGGVDAIEALLHAMQMVGIELYTSEEHQSGRLRWGEAGSGYGFPLTQNVRDLLEGDDARFL